MPEKLVKPAIFAWFGAVFASGLGLVNIFGPVAVLLMGFILGVRVPGPEDQFGKVMITIITAGAILAGLWL